MANRKARKSVSSSQKGNNRPAKRMFSLNKHNVVIVAGLISLIGVLAAAVLASTGSVAVATISNWDKLRGGQETPESARETEDLLAFIDHRNQVVESGLDATLSQAQKAEGQVSEQDALVTRDVAEIVKEKRAAVRREYQQLIDAIKSKKRLQAEMHRTGINTTILQMREEINHRRSSVPALQKHIQDVDYILRAQDTPPSNPILREFWEMKKAKKGVGV